MKNLRKIIEKNKTGINYWKVIRKKRKYTHKAEILSTLNEKIKQGNWKERSLRDLFYNVNKMKN